MKEVIIILGNKGSDKQAMSNIYVISDTHFHHENIIKYCDRPFLFMSEMDGVMVDRWNDTVVNDDDIVIHCGDFALGNADIIKRYANCLKGHKILIRGNHDRKGIGFFESCGFEVIRQNYYTLGIINDGQLHKYIFSHAPMDNNLIPEDTLNIHGHIHNYPLNEKFNKDNHKCVSVECIGYRPLKLSK